jgi:hypothetical protein
MASRAGARDEGKWGSSCGSMTSCKSISHSTLDVMWYKDSLHNACYQAMDVKDKKCKYGYHLARRIAMPLELI